MRWLVASALSLAELTVVDAAAQPRSQLVPFQGAPVIEQSTIAAPLPAPPLNENAPVAEFLRAAERALAAGRTGEAQEALEMAQTRLLDRSVPLGRTDQPSEQPAVKLITQGLQALAVGDRATCLRMIQAAAAAGTS